MVGRRDANLRCGDLSEALGILILRQFALVAEVPRPEDVGVDAVCTLLKPGGDRSLVSDASFYVQIKSSSVRRIMYEGPSYDWFASLDLPFFIASVDRSAGRLELYTTEPARHQSLHHMRRAILLLDEPKQRAFSGDPFSAQEGSEGDVVSHRWLGTPVFTVSLPSVDVRALAGDAYRAITPWVRHGRRAIELLKNNIWLMTEWDGTSRTPGPGLPLVTSHPNEAQALLEDMEPLLVKLALAVGYDQVCTGRATPQEKPEAMLLYHFLCAVWPERHPLPPPPGVPNPPGSHWVTSNVRPKEEDGRE